MSPIDDLIARVGVPPLAGLASWDSRVRKWCGEYTAQHGVAEISEINLGFAVFLFDSVGERVTLAYAISVPQLHRRDRVRMRGFPDVQVGVRSILGRHAFNADRGHFLGHASGGELDINLFPHRRELNRGWSEDGKLFRRMERHVAERPDCFFYHRPEYDDTSWVPAALEFGVLREDGRWWKERFQNKLLATDL